MSFILLTAFEFFKFMLIATLGISLYSYLYPPTQEAYLDILSDLSTDLAVTSIKSKFCKQVTLPPRSTVLTNSTALPYINSQAFLSHLHHYVCTFPLRDVLVVWGPKSTGKTFGIEEMRKVWSHQGRIVIVVDLKGFIGKLDNFIEYFRQSLLLAMGHVSFSHEQLRSLYLCSRHKSKILESYPTLISRLLDWLGLKRAASIRSLEDARWFDDFETYISFFFSSKYHALGIDIQGLFETLELIARQQPDLAPIIIFRELQYLNEIGGQVIIKEILQSNEPKKQGKDIVPIIIESSDYVWLLESESIVRSWESFSTLEVTYMDKVTTRNELVDTLKVFTEEQFEQVWTATKGHAGSIEFIFRYMHRGMTLDDAINTVKSATYRFLLHQMVRAGDLLGMCKQELVRMRDNGWVLKEENPHKVFDW